MDPLFFLSKNLENKIITRHLLEACVHMKSTLLRPLRKHELKAYIGLKSYHVTPQILSPEELQAIPSQEVISSLSYWNVHILPKKIQYSSSKDPNYQTDFIVLFSSKQHQLRPKKSLQIGVPFDVKYHLLNNTLTLQRTYDYQPAPKRSLENQKPSLHQVMELVTDINGGFLYYCGKRDVYHWKRSFLSMNYYDSLRYKKLSCTSSSSFRLGGGTKEGSGSPSSLLSPAYTGRGRGGQAEENGEERRQQQIQLQNLESMKERMRYSLAKRSYSYRPLALLEKRTQNIWSDLEMTKNPSSSSSVPLSSPTKNTITSAFKNIMRVITEDEDEDGGNEKKKKIGGNEDPLCFNDYLLLHSEITPLNIPLINQNEQRLQQRQHLNHLYLTINHQFIHLIISSHLYPPYPLPLPLHPHPPPRGGGPTVPVHRITPHDVPDTEPLSFELEFTNNDYVTYSDLVLDLVDSPLSIQSLIHLAEYLLQKQLYYETYFTLLRIIEISSPPSPSGSTSASPSSFNNSEEYCLIVLYALYLHLLCASGSYQSIPAILKLVLTLCPTSALILSYAARVYHQYQLQTQAEELYIGAMLIDPLSCYALHGYSLLLIDRGEYQLACRYLNRILSSAAASTGAPGGSAYVFSPFIRLQYVWIQEILGKQSHLSQEGSTSASSSGSNPYLDALLHQYQLILPHCTGSSSSSSSNKLVLSLVLASIGHFYHIYQNNLTKAMEFYLRSLKAFPSQNGYSHGMYACALCSELDHQATGTRIQLINTLKQKKDPIPTTGATRDGNSFKSSISRPGLETELIVNSRDEEIDATFRKSLFYTKGSNR